jgi:hypothetical protein
MPRTAVEIYRKLSYYSLLKKNSGPCSSLHPSDKRRTKVERTKRSRAQIYGRSYIWAGAGSKQFQASQQASYNQTGVPKKQKQQFRAVGVIQYKRIWLNSS